jgi:hypothetical protein
MILLRAIGKNILILPSVKNGLRRSDAVKLITDFKGEKNG